MKQGVVMEIQAKNAYVFTNECDLVKMPVHIDMFVGQSIVLPEPKAQSAMPRRWLVPVLAAACIILLICSGLLLSAILLPRAGTVYLSLDVNPSVEFELDDTRKVIEVTPLNADAWELLQKVNLIGLNYEDAIVQWVETLRNNRPQQFEDLLISAILDKRDLEFADQIMALNGDQAAQKLAGLAGLKVRVLFSMDRAVKEQADANKLSVGRQMLFNLAIEKKLDLTVDNIRSSSLSDLVNSLLLEETTETLDETTAEETSKESTVETMLEPSQETSETAAVTEPSQKTSETTAETTKATTRTTTNATTKATTTASLQLAAVSSDSGWTLEWTPSPTGKDLSYYKVVISQTDSTPKYPDNGYLFALSRENNSCLVNNSQAYHGGDFDGHLTVGQKYHVGITYVFKDGSKITTNVLHLVYNGPSAVVETTAPFSAELAGYSDETGVHLSWSIGPESGFQGYKVVISKNQSSPAYPDDGYLYWITNKSETSCLADNTAAYNGGDFEGYLLTGQTYNFAITYVLDSGKITSNVLTFEYKVPTE